MEKQHILLLIFFLFVLTPIADAKHKCSPASCGPNQPEIRFPLRILNRQPAKCGYPGFELSCDEQNRTIIRLPLSLSYIVKRISYLEQAIYINPEFCLPNRIVSVNTTNTPFTSGMGTRNYDFYNCSLKNYTLKDDDTPFPCLSNRNYSVIAEQTAPWLRARMPSSCKLMETIALPIGLNKDFSDELELMWVFPYCISCERKGKSCRLKSDDIGDTTCVSSSDGISRSAKYGLSIGIGVPALICIIWFACYASSRVQGHNDSNNQGIDLSSLAIIRQPASRMGLDGPTIESYPKTVVGDSCSLPNDERICAICLSDYKAKDILRTIPECNHYFHVECIDAWLKLNVTCPVCRKTPDISTLVTPVPTHNHQFL